MLLYFFLVSIVITEKFDAVLVPVLLHMTFTTIFGSFQGLFLLPGF